MNRGRVVSPSAKPTVRFPAVAATCIPIFLAVAVLPGIMHSIPLLLVAAFGLSSTLAPPDAGEAQPPSVLLPMAGENTPRACYFPVWVFPSSRATRFRSLVIRLLYISCGLVIAAQCVWQSPLFAGWNELHALRPITTEGNTSACNSALVNTAVEWTLINGGAGIGSGSVGFNTSVSGETAILSNLWRNTMQSSWYRGWGLYHIRTFIDLAADPTGAVTTNQTAVNTTSVTPSPFVAMVQHDGSALDSALTRRDSSPTSIVARVIAQVVLYFIAMLVIQRAPASIYVLKNDVPSYHSYTPLMRKRSVRSLKAHLAVLRGRSSLFRSAAADMLLQEDNPTVMRLRDDVDPQTMFGKYDVLGGAAGAIRYALDTFAKPATSREDDKRKTHDEKGVGSWVQGTVDVLLHRGFVILQSLAKVMFHWAPWATLVCAALTTVSLPSLMSLAVVVPVGVYLSAGPKPSLFLGRTCAVVAVVLSLWVTAIVVFVGTGDVGAALTSPYDVSSWTWYVLLGPPRALTLAEYSFQVLCVSHLILLLVATFLRCVDAEMTLDCLDEANIARNDRASRLRLQAPVVVEALAAENLKPTLSNIAAVAPGLAALHPLHRVLLMSTTADSTMEEMCSELWTMMHLMRARLVLSSDDWSILYKRWGMLDEKHTHVTLRMVSSESALDPMLRLAETTMHPLPWTIVRSEILPRLPSVRWLLNEEEFVLLLQLLDSTLHPPSSVIDTHWTKREVFVEDVILMAALFAEGATFLKRRDHRFYEQPLNATREEAPPATQGEAEEEEEENDNDVSLWNDSERNPWNESACEKEVDRNDAWRTLRILRALYHYEHSSRSSALLDAASISPNVSFAGMTAVLRAITSEVAFGHPCQSITQQTGALSPGSDWSNTVSWFLQLCSAGVGGWRMSLVDHLSRVAIDVAEQESQQQQQGDDQTLLFTKEVDVGGDFTPPQSSSFCGDDTTTSTGLATQSPLDYNVSFATAKVKRQNTGGVDQDLAKDATTSGLVPLLLSSRSMATQTLRAIAQALFIVVSVMWHTLGLSSLLSATFLFWAASYRRTYDATHALVLAMSVVLVITSGVGASSLRYQVTVAATASIVLALCTSVAGTIFRYAIASTSGPSLSLMRNYSYTDVHANVYFNLGVSSVQGTHWELLLYWVAMLLLHLQRRAYYVEAQKEQLLHELAHVKTLGSNTTSNTTTTASPFRHAWLQLVQSSSFVVSWSYLKQALHWRVTSENNFVVRGQFYAAVIVAAVLFATLTGFTQPSYLSSFFLTVYLMIVIGGSIHRRALESRGFRRLLFLVGTSNAMVVIAFGVLHLPAVRYAIEQALETNFLANNGTSFCGLNCGWSRLLVKNSTLLWSTVTSSMDDWRHTMVGACMEEIGIAKLHTEASSEGNTVLPYFAGVLFCAVEWWALKPLSEPSKDMPSEGEKGVHHSEASSHEPAMEEELRETTTTTSNAVHVAPQEKISTASPLLALLHKAALVAIFITQHNIHKIMWIVCLFAATHQVTLLSLPYLVFFLLDVTGVVPIVYSALHLIAIHVYDLSAIPVYWSGAGLELVGLPKSIAFVSSWNGTMLTDGNRSFITTDQRHVWQGGTPSLILGPALVLGFNLLLKNTQSMVDSLDDDEVAAAANAQGASWRANPIVQSIQRHRFVVDALISMKILFVFMFSEAVRSFAWEWLQLALLVGIAVNDLRFAQWPFLLFWLLLQWLDPRVLLTNRMLQRSALLFFALLLSGTVVLKLRMPLKGSDASDTASFLSVDQTLSNPLYINQMFFLSSEWISSLYGAYLERYSYAKYAGAQPTTGLFWCYGVVIALLKLIRRDEPYHQRREEVHYRLRGYLFQQCTEAVAHMRQPIAMARWHLLRLFTVLKPVPTRAAESNSSPFEASATTRGSSEPVAASKPWHARDRPILQWLFGEGLASPRDARATAWEGELVAEEAKLRHSVPAHKRLHLSFSESQSMLIFYFTKVLALVFLPPFLVFGDGNSNESLLHTVIVIASLWLFRSTMSWSSHFRPEEVLPTVLKGYQAVVAVTVVCNVPTIAAFIENHSQPFRALGMTHRLTTSDDSGSLHTTETTMSLTAWRVVAIWVCVLYVRLHRNFASLGVLATIQDMAIRSHRRHWALQEAVRRVEEAEEEELKRRGAARAELMQRLRVAVVEDASPAEGALVCEEAFERDEAIHHNSTKRQHQRRSVDVENRLSTILPHSPTVAETTSKPVPSLAQKPIKKSLMQRVVHTLRAWSWFADAVEEERIRVLPSAAPIPNQPAAAAHDDPLNGAGADSKPLRPSGEDVCLEETTRLKRLYTATTVDDDEAAAAAATSNKEEDDVSFFTFLRVLLRAVAFRTDAIVLFVLGVNFLESGGVLDAIPLLMAMVIGVVWYPFVSRKMILMAIQTTSIIILVKTVTRFLTGQFVLTPDNARTLGAMVVQTPADETLGTYTGGSSAITSRSHGVTESIVDIALDFASLAALWLYLRVGEVYGLFPVGNDEIRGAEDDTLLSEDSAVDEDDKDDTSSSLSLVTNPDDVDAVEAADRRRQEELDALEHDIQEYELAMKDVAAQQGNSQEQEDASLGQRSSLLPAPITEVDSVHNVVRPLDGSNFDGPGSELSPQALIRLVRAAEYKRLLKLQTRRLVGTSDKAEKDAKEQEEGRRDRPTIGESGQQEPALLLSNIDRKAGNGVDMYTYSFLVEIVCLIYVAFGYHSMAGLQGGFVQSIIDNLLPGWLVLWLIFSVLIMTIDRAIYVLSASSFAIAQRLKLALHASLSVFYVIFYISWSSTTASDASFPVGSGLMALKLVYLIISGYQLRLGFPTFRRHDPMTASPRWQLVYSVYRAIPFLWELRMLVDWSCTRTTLNFSQFLKVEDVHHEVYLVYCDVLGEEPRKRGTVLKFSEKAGQGCGLFLLAVAAIFFPMLYYSTFNPVLTPNLVNGGVLTIEADAFGGLLKMTSTSTTNSAIQSSGVAAIDLLFPSLRSSGLIGSNIDMQLLQLSQCSAERWATTLPFRSALMTRLTSCASASDGSASALLHIRLDLDRDRVIDAGGSTTTGSIQYSYSMSPSQCSSLAAAVNQTLSAPSSSMLSNTTSSLGTILLANLLVPFVWNSGTNFALGGDAPLSQPSSYGASCALTLMPEAIGSVTTGEFYWCLSCQPLFSLSNDVDVEASSPTGDDYECLSSRRPSTCSSLHYSDWTSTKSTMKPLSEAPYVVVSSQQIPATSSLPINVGIIALYVTFILAIANMLRDMLAGNATKAMLEEMRDPKPLAEMLGYLLMCRGGGDEGSTAAADPVLEEALFLELVDLLRSPDALCKATGLRSQSYDSEGILLSVKMPNNW